MTRTVLFLHIPRTAGSTLHGIMKKQYAEDEMFTGQLLFGDEIASFTALPEERKRNLKIVKGHFAHGVHDLLPGDHAYMTFLRDPIDRVVSLYHFVKRRPDNSLHEAATSMSLKDFVASGVAPTHTDNGMTRFLGGAAMDDFGTITAEVLDRAIVNLEACAVIGLTERFDESLLLCRKAFGWNEPVFYERQNVTQNRPAIETLDPETLAAIEATNQLDSILFEKGVTLFEERVAALGPAFQARIATFKVTNPTYGILRRRVNVWRARRTAS